MVAFLCANGDDIGNRYTVLASSINFRRSNDPVEKRKKKRTGRDEYFIENRITEGQTIFFSLFKDDLQLNENSRLVVRDRDRLQGFC